MHRGTDNRSFAGIQFKPEFIVQRIAQLCFGCNRPPLHPVLHAPNSNMSVVKRLAAPRTRPGGNGIGGEQRGGLGGCEPAGNLMIDRKGRMMHEAVNIGPFRPQPNLQQRV